MRNVICGFLLGLSAIFLCATAIRAQTFDFTYQGRLLNGTTPATGSYDFEFMLFEDAVGGSTSLGTINRFGVPVSNGIFTVQLGFGGQFSGPARFLEIRVRQAGIGSYALLSPRQPVLSSPYAIKSLNAAFADEAQNASTLGGQSAGNYVLTTDPRMTDARSPTVGSTDYIQNGTTIQPATSFAVSGTGFAGTINSGTQYNIGGGRVLGIAGVRNVFVGFGAGAANTGQQNTFVGGSAGQANTNSSFNSFYGSQAGLSNSSGSGNSFFGTNAGQSTTTTSNNSFFGVQAGLNNTGFDNTFVGASAGTGNTSGNQNVFVGRSSGLFNTTSSSTTLIGFQANVGVDGLTNATAIGANATVSRNNAVVLGFVNTNVGIGTSVPNAKLHVSGGNVYVAGSPNGVILTAPDGTCWRINVGNTGALTTISTNCP